MYVKSSNIRTEIVKNVKGVHGNREKNRDKELINKLMAKKKENCCETL